MMITDYFPRWPEGKAIPTKEARHGVFLCMVHESDTLVKKAHHNWDRHINSVLFAYRTSEKKQYKDDPPFRDAPTRSKLEGEHQPAETRTRQ